MQTHRPDPFLPDRKYRVRKEFKAGEILVYQKNAYSIYDNMSGFFFHDSAQQWRSWDLRDGESLEVWPELFELMP